MADFAVWAPLPRRVRLEISGTSYDMDRADDGWWRRTVECPDDARYGFVLDDDPTVLPDPRSARQPDGVHRPLATVGPAGGGVDRQRVGRPRSSMAR